jgi:hypothetical protein
VIVLENILFIPRALENRCKLIKLKWHSKNPDQDTWSLEDSFYPTDTKIIEHVASGNNYGIIPINNTIVIDCDSEKLYSVIPAKWKETLTTITGRSGVIGRHLFFDCSDSPTEKVSINDPDNPSVQLGDVRGSESKFYTVGAGSIHPDTERRYKYKNPGASLISISWKEIQTELFDKFKVKIKESIPYKTNKISTNPLTDKLNLRIERFAMPTGKIERRSNGDIQGSHPIHGSTTGMNFSINPLKNIWYCYRCSVGGDPISWISYAHCGVPENDCNNLSDDQFKEVVEWLRNNGYEKELNKLDEKYFPNLNVELIDEESINNIMNQKPPIVQSTKDQSTKESNPFGNMIELEIKAAEERCKLPPFPEMDDGLFKDYIELGKRVSYSLHEFHFAALLSIVSMAIKRRVVIQVGMTKIYPNVFTMVVGHTTISGKSVACNMAIDSFSSAIIHEENLNKLQSTNLLRGTISEPALIQGLDETYNSLWYYDDCAGFFEDAANWNAHVLGTMCSLYDCTAVERTLSKRGKNGEKYKWECPTPFVSILFNTTNRDIETVASARLFSSGFFPRLMWFYGQGGTPRKNENVSESDKKITREIFKEIASLRTKLEIYPDDGIVFGVCNEIEDWKLNSTMGKLNAEDESYRTAISRGFIHAYKIAAILTLVDKDFQNNIPIKLKNLESNEKYTPIVLSIPHKHAMMAIKIVDEYLIPRMMHVYDLCNHSDAKNHQVIVRKAIIGFGGSVERTKLLKKTHLNSKDLNTALNTMVESGEIKMYESKKGGSDKPTTFVILKD